MGPSEEFLVWNLYFDSHISEVWNKIQIAQENDS